MLPGVRFAAWIASWAFKWKVPVADWIIDWIMRGAMRILEVLEPEAVDLVKDTLQKIADHPATPDEMKRIISLVTAGTKPLPLLLLIPIAILFFIPTITAIFQPLGNLLRYVQERVFHSYRLDPGTLTELLRRDPTRFANLEDDLNDLGWSAERQEAFRELLKRIPPLPDMVRFADFSAFDPVVIEKWREYYDAPEWIKVPFSLLGVTGEWSDRYWFSHWTQPGRFELGLMHRRGLIDDDTVKLAYKTMGYSEFWQDSLLNLVREVPTRVDVRRWWDMRTIDEEELRRIYHAQGYYDQDLDNYVLWTKVYVAFPDLLARWQKGWITLDDIRTELVGLGMPVDRVEELIQTKVQADSAARTTAERDLTKTDIYKGVKQGRITRDEGQELLMDLGYDEDEADYLLAINIPVDEEEQQVEYRQLTKADIRAALRDEIITETVARERLLELRYSPSDTTLLIRIFQATIEPPEEVKGREASKADIVTGVKKGIITQEEGYLMLQDIGFTPEASEFILSVRTEESPFSPVSYDEFKDLTTKYRIAAGRQAKPVPEELRAAADKLVRIKLEVAALESAEKEEQGKLTPDEEVPDAAKKKLREVQVALNRARSELDRIQLDYNSLVARWKHGAI